MINSGLLSANELLLLMLLLLPLLLLLLLLLLSLLIVSTVRWLFSSAVDLTPDPDLTRILRFHRNGPKSSQLFWQSSQLWWLPNIALQGLINCAVEFSFRDGYCISSQVFESGLVIASHSLRGQGRMLYTDVYRVLSV